MDKQLIHTPAVNCAYCKGSPVLDATDCYRVECVNKRCVAKPLRAGGSMQEAVDLWNYAMSFVPNVGVRYHSAIDCLRKFADSPTMAGELVSARNEARRIVEEHDATS